MRRVEIDEDVYEELAKHARGFEQPNDVLRRLLLAPEQVQRASEVVTRSSNGRLRILLDAGLVKPGDKLVHHKPRLRQTYFATVTSEGAIETDMGVYPEPSPALKDLTGSEVNGWKHWTHATSGKSLRDLRDSLG